MSFRYIERLNMVNSQTKIVQKQRSSDFLYNYELQKVWKGTSLVKNSLAFSSLALVPTKRALLLKSRASYVDQEQTSIKIRSI
jgi:hypothetical protein